MRDTAQGQDQTGHEGRIETRMLPLVSGGAQAFWDGVARSADDWLTRQGLSARDAVLILPFAQHLAPARRAWRQLGRWQPRIETSHSLASALRPSPLSQGLQISFDAAIDALNASQLLAGQSWAQALRQQDARAYRLALRQLVEAAQAFARHAQQLAPSERAEFWTQGRVALQQEGPGTTERALTLVALEWAASDPRQPATDALFALLPSAWLVLQAGGADPLMQALLRHAALQQRPALRLLADQSLDEVFEQGVRLARVEQAVCLDREELAQCSAAAVIEHLQQGRSPVALVAQDRVLVRRIRALLERQSLRIGDETGWTLATAPEAAQLMALLRAASPQASMDELLAWLKSELAGVLRQRHGEDSLGLLESRCRALGWTQPRAVRPERLPPAAAGLWQGAQTMLALLRAGAAQRSLEQWLDQLRQLLQALDAMSLLEQREGGAQLLDALWLRRSPWPGSAHELALQHAELRQGEFLTWVDECLEAQQFVPGLQAGLQVLITPLARAMLRPFGALVLPGADAQTLGPVPAGPALISDPLARQLGLPDRETRRQALAAAFVQLLRAPALTLLRCGWSGAEPLAASPLLDRLAAAHERAGLGMLQDWQDTRPVQAVSLSPRHRAVARAPGRLPAQLSASAVESLRNCPYQFFARSVLGLREEAELEEQVDKRDYGTWLHAVLHQFHVQRLQPPASDEPQLDDAARLQALALQELQRLQLAPAEFLPYLASFRGFVPRYLGWLRAQEAQGWGFQSGELDREVQPWAEAPLAGLRLRGRLDRVDAGPQGLQLIDYKTGSAAGLKARLTEPLEDTQLVVYGLLMAETAQALGAVYLPLDDAKGMEALPHEDLMSDVPVLAQGLGEDLRALHGGQALPAFGEGVVCNYCEARGICRKDDWWEGGA